ncbi:MAG: hypothetical protein M3Y81_08965 [Chloroflexota bacterium]|nr:hypothetical protein [Chloroflexota bacterium]
MSLPTHPSSLQLASVKDAHNQGASVQILGEAHTAQALYDANLQAGGVVIRPCHLVIVDTARQPWEIVWRIGTRGVVLALDEATLTLDLDYRSITLPLDDRRPDDEKLHAPLAVGMEVLLRGRLEEASVADIFLDGKPTHPERLNILLAEIIARDHQEACSL